jgi:hypothetical protein
VVAGLRDFAEDLHALVRELDACTPTDLLEAHHRALDFALVGLHRPSPKSE